MSEKMKIRISLLLILLLLISYFIEFYIFNIYYVNENLKPVIGLCFIETTMVHKIIYYSVNFFFLFSALLLVKTNFKRSTKLIIIETVFWLFKYLFIRNYNYYYQVDSLEFPEPYNYFSINFDILSLIIRLLLLFLLFHKKLNFKLFIKYIIFAYILIVIKNRYLNFPFIYVDWL